MKEPIILAVETATSACSAALLVEGHLYARFEQTNNAHTQLILPMIDALLKESKISLQELDAIAVGRGPGSFTGVRIAVSCAQGLGFGLNIPIYPISTLEALCLQAQANHDEDEPEPVIVLTALDARMHEIYAAAYNLEKNHIACLSQENIYAPGELLSHIDLPHQKIKAIGSGWDVYFQEIIGEHASWDIDMNPQCFPDAKHVAQLAKAKWHKGEKPLLAEALLPVYLRDKVTG